MPVIFLVDQSVDVSRLPTTSSSDPDSVAFSDAIVYLKPPSGFSRWLSSASDAQNSHSLLSAALDTSDPSLTCSAVDLSLQTRYDEHIPTLLPLLVKSLLPAAVGRLLQSQTPSPSPYLSISVGALGKEACAVALTLLSLSSRVPSSSSSSSPLLKLCTATLPPLAPLPVVLTHLLLLPSSSTVSLDHPHDGGSYLPLSNPLSTSSDCGSRAPFRSGGPLCTVVFMSPPLPTSPPRSEPAPLRARHLATTRALSRRIVPRLGMAFCSVVHQGLSESSAELIEAAAVFANEWGGKAGGGGRDEVDLDGLAIDEDGDRTFDYKGSIAYYFPPYYGPVESDSDSDAEKNGRDSDSDSHCDAVRSPAPPAPSRPPVVAAASSSSTPSPPISIPGVSLSSPLSLSYTLSPLPGGLTRCSFHIPARLLPLLTTSAVSCNGCFFELHADLDCPSPSTTSASPARSSGLGGEGEAEDDDDDDDDDSALRSLESEPFAYLHTDFLSPNPHFTARAIALRLESRARDPGGGEAAKGCVVS